LENPPQTKANVKSGKELNVAVFTARRYASALCAVIVCQSVHLSVRLLQTYVLPRWLNHISCKQHRTIAQGL